MTQLQIRFPRLCAWCGTRPPSKDRPVELQYNRNRRTARMKFEAPVCEKCEPYAVKMQKASKTRTWGTIIASFLVGLLLALLVAFGSDETSILFPMWICLGFGITTVALLVMARGLDKRLDRRLAGEPPEAYASSDELPAKMTGERTLLFYCKMYHAKFAELNPGLVEQEQQKP